MSFCITVLTGVKAALAYKPHPDFEHPIKKKKKCRGKKKKKKKEKKKEKKITERDRGAAAVLLNLRRYEVWLIVSHSLRVFFPRVLKNVRLWF